VCHGAQECPHKDLLQARHYLKRLFRQSHIDRGLLKDRMIVIVLRHSMTHFPNPEGSENKAIYPEPIGFGPRISRKCLQGSSRSRRQKSRIRYFTPGNRLLISVEGHTRQLFCVRQPWISKQLSSILRRRYLYGRSEV
jgi:hypothetical protein